MSGKLIVHIEKWQQLARESKFSADLLAVQLGISRRQLQRYTQVKFGRSPQKWLNEERLIEASIRLRNDNSVKAVSIELGFKQVSHFSREYKKFFCHPPSRSQ